MQILKFVNGRQIGLRHHRLLNEYAKIFEHSENIAIDVDKILNRKIPFSPPPPPPKKPTRTIFLFIRL